MSISSTVHAQSILVILGIKNTEDEEVKKELVRIMEGTYMNEENTEMKNEVILCRLENKTLANIMAARIHGAVIKEQKVVAVTLDKYMALYRMAQTSKESMKADRPAVKRIVTGEEIEEWRMSSYGEQFIVYTEDVVTNYELSKMFPCKEIKTKNIVQSSISVHRDVVVAHRNKNIFVYGGLLELLDAHVKDNIVKYEMHGEHISITSKVSAEKSVWEVYNIYTKKEVKSVEIHADTEVRMTKDMTHYVVQSTDGKIGEIREMSTDKSVIVEKKRAKETEKVEITCSEHDNVIVVATAVQVGTRVALYDMSTEKEVRSKVYTNMESYEIRYNEGEAVIVNVRSVGGSSVTFVDVWDVRGESVVSKALGESVKSVHFGTGMMVAVSSTHAHVYKRVHGRIVETEKIRGGYSMVEIKEIAAMYDGEKLVLVNREGETMYEKEMKGVKRMEWSVFGMYLAVVYAGQVYVMNVMGNEVYVGNIKSSENGFYWRTVLTPEYSVALTPEMAQRYKEEDAQKKKQAKQQLRDENKELVSEWTEFLQRMQRLYVAAK